MDASAEKSQTGELRYYLAVERTFLAGFRTTARSI